MTRILPAHGVRGGMEHHGQLLCRLLWERGHEVVVATTALPADISPPDADPWPVHFLVGTRPGIYSRSWWQKSVAWFAAEHARRPFDVLLSQSGGARALLWPGRGTVARGGVPAVVIVHGEVADGALMEEWRIALSRPLDLRHVARLALNLPREAQTYAQDIIMLRQATAVIAVSQPMVDVLATRCLVPRSRLHLVPYGIDTALFRPDPAAGAALRAQLGIRPDQPVLFNVARLEARKGQSVLLRALPAIAARYPDVHLCIAGDGPEHAALVALAKELGVTGRVTFLGYVPVEKLPAYYAMADCFVQPSIHHETLPLAIIEAMACGVPVVASRIASHAWMLAPDPGSRICAPGDPADLARAIADVLARGTDPDAAERRRARMVGQFDWATMGDAIERILLAISGQRARQEARA